MSKQIDLMMADAESLPIGRLCCASVRPVRRFQMWLLALGDGTPLSLT